MKYLITLLLAASFLFAGCNTPNKAENTALTAAKIEANSTTAAMQAFVAYEKQFGATKELRERVDSAYQKVRLANLAAEGLWIAYKKAAAENAPNANVLLSAYQNALQSLAMSSAELIAFIVQITAR